MYKGLKILAVVPARGGSKGVKLKNLREVGGIPLVGHVGKVLSNLEIVDQKVVSTDHEQIAEVSKEYGINVPFYRPESLSGDRIGDLDVLTHALIECEKNDSTKYDIVLMLQPTSPFRTENHVLRCVEKLVAGNYSSVWTVSETDSKGHPFKQFVLNDDRLDYYDKENGEKIIARQQLKPTYHRDGVCYAITRDCLLDQKSIRGDKPGFEVVKEQMVNIDTELDLKLANFFYNELK